jgi:SAM-dependent methyltransferase
MPPVERPFKDHFSDRAAAYAAHRPTYPVALVDFLAEVAPRRELAWDSGCGSGQLSVLLAGRFERVIATDASAEQIAQAAPHPKVRYLHARAEASGLPGATVDLAVAAQAAHWFDLAGYYAEVRRVARPGAVIALATYATMSIDDDVDPVVRRFYADVVGPYWPPERRHTEDGYRSLPFPFDEIPAPELEMRADWALADVIGYVATWSAVRAMAQATGRAPLEAFRRDLARAWGERGGSEATVRPVRWPLSLRVGRLR